MNDKEKEILTTMEQLKTWECGLVRRFEDVEEQIEIMWKEGLEDAREAMHLLPLILSSLRNLKGSYRLMMDNIRYEVEKND